MRTSGLSQNPDAVGRTIIPMSFSRRGFLSHTTAGFAGLSGLLVGGCDAVPNPNWSAEGYGELLADPEGLLDLPQGFSYNVFSRVSDEMDDGLLVPGAHDGTAAFAGANGHTILVRNHELEPDQAGESAFGSSLERARLVAEASLYDPGSGEMPGLGGTTTLVYDTQKQQLVRQFLSLAGTMRNCAGGSTPWGSWVSCEETIQLKDGPLEQNHGYNFEVPAGDEPLITIPRPLKAMGRFNHEAIAVHEPSGVVYQTEDRQDGMLYRFVPHEKGRLMAGGRLQALALRDQASADTRNWSDPSVALKQPMPVRWIDLQDVESLGDELRAQGAAAGAAIFARGEGAWTDGDDIYFACTDGGPAECGQVFRYRVSADEATAEEERNPGRLELFAESPDSRLLDYGDNLTISPWGDVILCEDGSGVDHVVGVTPQGQFYQLARNAFNDGEFTGSVFSPDGSTLFVNIQNPGMTFAITGPWKLRAA